MDRILTHTVGWWHQLQHRIATLRVEDERGSVTIETVVWAVAVIAIAAVAVAAVTGFVNNEVAKIR